LISREHGMSVDLQGFERELQAQKERSRNAAAVDTDDWVETVPVKDSEFVGYDTLTANIKIAKYRRVTAKNKTFYQLVFDRTPFYGNSGGQSGDCGYIESANERVAIVDTLKDNNLTVHISDTLPENPTADFVAVVNREKRDASANNHTATHLLHEALRTVLGTHVEQKGSLVNPDYLRFDFSHFQKVEADELKRVERLVNAAIRTNHPLDENRACSIDHARESGAMMLFGEKYGDVVRMVRFGSSVELCGGTHASATGNIGYFRIVSESAISAGVRRIEAVTGAKAEDMVYTLQDTLQGVQQIVNNPACLQAVRKMSEDNCELRRQIDEMVREKIKSFVEGLVAECGAGKGDGMILTKEVDFATEHLRDVAFAVMARMSNLALVLGTRSGDKVSLAVVLGDDVIAKGANASEIVRSAAKAIEGGGGGQPFFATAGGKKPEGLAAAMKTASEMISNIIG
jgi:alanyl-tRNA synthetase